MSNTKTKAPKYFTGLTPKRGFTTQFKAIDVEIRELNGYLTHYVIQSVNGDRSKVNETRAKIVEKLIEIKKYSDSK